MPTNNTSSLTGRTALVTGGAGGLGRAIALELHACGAHVAIADIDKDGAAATAAACGERAEAVWMDVSDPESVRAAVEDLAAAHGASFDLLVNNAGTDRGAPVVDVTDDAWHTVFGVNLHGPMYTSRAFLRHVLGLPDGQRPRGVADILNIVSISALTVGGGAGAYNSPRPPCSS